MFYVYVYYSLIDKKFYIGYTSNLKQRKQDHKNKKVKSTANRKDLVMIFYEAYMFKEDAQRREKYFKTTKGKKALRQMMRETLKKLNKE